MKKFNCVSLFSGALGMDLGIERAGFEIKLVLENDKNTIATIKENRPHIPLIDRDIMQVSPNEILDKAGLKKNEVDLIIAGPPCQPFSTAGRRKALNDSRGSVFTKFVDILDYIKPKYFVMENVKGILSSALKHRPIDKRDKLHPLTDEEVHGSVLRFILKEFERAGYGNVEPFVLNSANFGVPQKRERVFFIGNRIGKKIPMPEPTHSEGNKELPKWKTLGDAIKGLEKDKVEFTKTNGNLLKYMTMVKPGGNWRSLPPKVQLEAMGNAIKSGGGKTGYFRRLSFDKPSPTLTTSPAQKATLLFHPTEDRVLAVEEYAAIQQFPENWKFVGGTSQKYKQIGNAVPVGLAEAVGKVVYRMLCEDSNQLM